jgi:nucleoside-diphosphate-sugar epimerase
MKRVLITGAAGAIGSVLRAGLAGTFSLLRLADVRPAGAARAGEEEVIADFSNLDAAVAATRGIDCVVHLAGVPREAEWERILRDVILRDVELRDVMLRDVILRDVILRDVVLRDVVLRD